MKSWKKFIIFTVSVISFSAPLKISNACGPEYPDDDIIRFQLFQPDVNGMAEYEPFYFTTHYLYDANNYIGDSIAKNKNVLEWKQQLGSKISEKSIADLVYNFQPAEYAEAIHFLESGKKADDSISKNEMLQALLKPGNEDLLQYLYFAKESEYYIFEPDPWEENYDSMWKANNPAYIRLRKNAFSKAGTEENAFLKLRYAFQYLKLTRRENPEARIEFFDKYIAPIKSTSIIYYWAQYHNAISHYNSGDGKADYLFAQLFDKAEDKRVGIYENFSGENFEETVSYCKNNHEKALVYSVKALKNPGRTLVDLQQIYNLEPNSKELVFLMNREVNKLEDWLLTPKIKDYAPRSKNLYFWDEEKSKSIIINNLKKDQAYLQKVRNFTNGIIYNPKSLNKAYWLITSAYLALLAQDYYACETYLNQASHISISEKMLLNQLHLTRLMLEINKQKQNSAAFEKILAKEINWLDVHKADFTNYWKCRRELFAYLAKRYENWGDIGRATLLNKQAEYEQVLDGVWVSTDYYNYLEEKGKPAHIDTILKILGKKEKTAYEKILVKDSLPFSEYESYNGKLYDYSFVDNSYTKFSYRALNRYKFLDIKGMLLLREEKVKEAYEVYRQIPDTFWNQDPYTLYLRGNPFFVNRDYPHASVVLDSIHYTKTSMLKRMIDLENEALQDPKKRALNYFLLGNAWFSFSYSGNSWLMLRSYWSQHESFNDMNNIAFSFRKIYYGNQPALKYYKLALENAKDAKFAALCAIRASECENNYRSVSRSGINLSTCNIYFNPYIIGVKNRFKSTKELDDLLECDLFNKYAVNFY